MEKQSIWNKLGWGALITFFIALLNGCGIAILIMLFLDPSKSAFVEGLEIAGFSDEQIKQIMALFNQNVDTTSFFGALEFKVQAGVVLGELIGFLLSIFVLYNLWSAKRTEKNVRLQGEVEMKKIDAEKQKQDKFLKMLEKKLKE